MDYNDFTRQIRRDLQASVETDFPGTTLEFRPVEKLQGESYTALTVTPPGQNLGMNINLNRLYDLHQQGEAYEKVLQSVKDMTAELMAHTPQFRIPELSDYEAVRQLLYVDVVGIQANAELLRKVPHTIWEDIAMVCRLQVGTSDSGSASVLITDSILESLGVSKEQLLADALANSPKLRPASVGRLSQVMAEMTGIPEEELPGILGGPEIFVVTTEDTTRGAAAVFYPNFMEEAAREMDAAGFFMLPSSVHEVLLLPDDGSLQVETLRNMVTTINADVVSPEDRLTDSVYHYDAESGLFELGECWEERTLAGGAVQKQ